MTAEERRILRKIRELYGPLLDAAAKRYGHRPEVLGGIMMRESRGGEALTPPGPAGTGDGGHGRGLCQIDDRWHKEFCAGEDWKDPEKNILKGAEILAGSHRYIATRAAALHLKTPKEIERAGIAGYNCGQGKVVQALAQGLDVDYFTTHGDYSRTVLRLARGYQDQVAM